MRMERLCQKAFKIGYLSLFSLARLDAYSHQVQESNWPDIHVSSLREAPEIGYTKFLPWKVRIDENESLSSIQVAPWRPCPARCRDLAWGLRLTTTHLDVEQPTFLSP